MHLQLLSVFVEWWIVCLWIYCHSTEASALGASLYKHIQIYQSKQCLVESMALPLYELKSPLLTKRWVLEVTTGLANVAADRDRLAGVSVDIVLSQKDTGAMESSVSVPNCEQYRRHH